jgi:hypothetical protein
MEAINAIGLAQERASFMVTSPFRQQHSAAER